MFKTTRNMVVLVLGLTALGALTVGPGLLVKLWRSGRAKVQARARALVDPQVELDEAVRTMERQLPKEIASLKIALRGCGKEATDQACEIRELAAGSRLIEADLKHLAASIHKGEGADLRGRRLDPQQCRQEAGRLLAKRKHYDSMVDRRKTLLAKLRQQEKDITRALAKTEAAMQEYGTKRRQLAAKIALLKAGERIQDLKKITETHSSADASSSLARLDRALDHRLQEQAERAKLQQGLVEDGYIQSVRDTDVLEELRRLYPPAKQAQDGEGQ